MKLSLNARRLLAVLRSYGSRIFPKQATLAAAMDLSLRSISRLVQELKDAGMIEVTSRGPSSSTYAVKNHRVTRENGVACVAVEKAPESPENPVEKLGIGVAFGVAFGVARPSVSLLLSEEELYTNNLRDRFVESDDGFPLFPNKPSEQTPQTPRKPPETALAWHKAIEGAAKRLALSRR